MTTALGVLAIFVLALTGITVALSFSRHRLGMAFLVAAAVVAILFGSAISVVALVAWVVVS